VVGRQELETEVFVTDHILIKDLLLRTIIGVSDEERRDRQDVLINVVLEADTRAAGASDNLNDAVNYRTITKRIINLVEGSQFYLVEKLAAEIAAVCLEDARVLRATVRVEKPGALRFARSVGVEIGRTRADLKLMTRVLVSLGSNIDPERNLQEAVRQLAGHCRLLAVSPVYETAPVGNLDQPNFLNAAALIETDLGPEELKAGVLERIEQNLARVRTEDKNAPRTIDLDISLFGDQVWQVRGRHIPDPDLLRFPHIAYPVADVAPHMRYPETGQTLQEIAHSLPPAGIVRRLDLQLWPQEFILT
jgi:dihydroneopterin aldolase/2-amino-4-hydroxy-6-hydroxymethyldihydropteridine diphosphokinase